MSIKTELSLALGLTVVFIVIAFVLGLLNPVKDNIQRPEIVAATVILWLVTVVDVARKLLGKGGIF